MRQTIINMFHRVQTRNILNILATALVLLAASFLVSCSGAANEADPDSPAGVVEIFYKNFGSGECDVAMQFLLFEGSREIKVFMVNGASPADIQRLDTEIHGMPEVESVYYVSKEEALKRFRESLNGYGDELNNLSGNPFPPSFEITVRDPKDTETVASRFFNNPVVDNSPGSQDGVRYRTASRNNEAVTSSTNFCDSVLSDNGYEITELNIISSSISDTGEATVKLEVTDTMDRVGSKSGEFSLTLVKLNGNWKIVVDESSSNTNSVAGLLGLIMIEIKESKQTIDTQEPGNIGPDAGIEIVPPPGP